MSELLDVPAKDNGRDWHVVVTLSPGRGHSPHYSYHGAIYCLDQAQLTFERFDVPRERRLALAEAIRDSWKRTGSDFRAYDLVHQLWDEARAGKYPER